MVDFTKFKKVNISHITVITKTNKENTIKQTENDKMIKTIKPMAFNPFIKPIFKTI